MRRPTFAQIKRRMKAARPKSRGRKRVKVKPGRPNMMTIATGGSTFEVPWGRWWIDTDGSRLTVIQSDGTATVYKGIQWHSIRLSAGPPPAAPVPSASPHSAARFPAPTA